MIVSIFIFPFIVDCYYWFNPECYFTPWSLDGNCSDYHFKNNLITSIANIVIGMITFLAIIFAVFYSRKNYGASSSKTANLERKLILQTFVSSFFLILTYVAFMVSSKFSHNEKVATIAQYLSNIFFFLHHYPGMIILFFVSSNFRNSFAEFYRITVVWKYINIGKSSGGQISQKIDVF